jgi:hypothetical protein
MVTPATGAAILVPFASEVHNKEPLALFAPVALSLAKRLKSAILFGPGRRSSQEGAHGYPKPALVGLGYGGSVL